MFETKRVLVLLALVSAAALVWNVGCRDETDGDADADSDADADGDADGDADTDADSDADGDADGDGDGDCAETEETCTETMPCCDETQICTLESAGATEGTCFVTCTPSTCDYGGAMGACIDYGTVALCQGATMGPTTCTQGTEGCTTEYGVSEGTLCVSDGTNTYCVETCEAVESGCEAGYICSPLSEPGMGVCVPGV